MWIMWIFQGECFWEKFLWVLSDKWKYFLKIFLLRIEATKRKGFSFHLYNAIPRFVKTSNKNSSLLHFNLTREGMTQTTHSALGGRDSYVHIPLLQWCLDLVYHYLVNYKNAGNRAWSHHKSTISTSFYTVTLQVEFILSVRKCNQNQLNHQLKKSIKNYFI